MDKMTYLTELAEGLARWVPERERQDILRYYAEYFEEAGADREADVVAELGDPWALSCRLAVEGGFVTQEKANAWTPRQSRRKLWLWAAVCGLVVVVLAGRAVGAIVSYATNIWRDDVATYAGPYAVVEEGTGNIGFVTIPEDPGVACVEQAEYISGYWTMEDGYLEAFDAVDVDISLGNISVCEGSDYTLYIEQSSGLDGYSLKWEVKDGVLKIRDASSEGHSIGLGGLQGIFGDKAVEVCITVPEWEEVDKIALKTALGNVFVANMTVEKVTAETNMGNVQCYEVREAKKVELKTDMGDVTFGVSELWDGVEIDLETSMGQVEANMNCPEQDCEYEIETDLGTVTVNGVSRGSKADSKGNKPYKLDAESEMGDVNVYFVEDWG